MKIPSVSKFQWHSFSITSSSVAENHTMSIIIKSEGWWTNTLYDLVLAKPDGEAHQNKCLPIAVEGPYGPTSVDFLRYLNDGIAWLFKMNLLLFEAAGFSSI